MSKQDAIANLSVRVARAEMERDAAFEKAARSEERERQSWKLQTAMRERNPEQILETLQVIGIPARELKDIYEIEAIWRRETGSEETRKSLLEWWRSRKDYK